MKVTLPLMIAGWEANVRGAISEGADRDRLMAAVRSLLTPDGELVVAVDTQTGEAVLRPPSERGPTGF